MIYMIRNTINGKFYIGSTSNFAKRKRRHLRELRNGRHHNIYMQRSYDKYGDVFEFVILMCNVSDLFKFEQLWINALCPEYNIGSVGGGDNMSNHPNLEDINKRTSQSLKKYYNNLTSEERKEKLGRHGSDNPNWKGGICSPNCKECGVDISPYHTHCVTCCKKGDRNPFYGKSHSKETKDKIRKSKLGQKSSNSIKVVIDDIVYDSMTDAAKALDVAVATIGNRIKSKHSPNYKRLDGDSSS